MVRLLLDAGADVNETPEQYAPMPLAVDLGLDRFLKLLLQRGADPTTTIGAKLLLDAGALAVAAQRGWVDSVLELVQSQPADSLDLADNRKRTPLFHATVTGHVAVAAILLAHGSRAMDSSMDASRTPRSVVEWTRRRLDLDPATQDTVKALADLFDDPATAKSTINSPEKVQTKPILCRPGEMRGSSHHDLWVFPETASQSRNPSVWRAVLSWG
ncbi:hypothetical protein BDV12DRAFT_202375 [Aspergillus spectabilis]